MTGVSFCKAAFVFCAAVLVGGLRAGAAAKADPVAEGYPDWQGLSAKSYICGREICPSDLRHKVTVVLEVEPNEKLQEQLLTAGAFPGKTGLLNLGEGVRWENFVLPRGVMFLVSLKGKGSAKDHESFASALKYAGKDFNAMMALQAYRCNGCAVYDNVTFTGAPDSAGKRPFVYVMGPTGREPLFKGELNAANVKAACAAIEKGRKEIAGWPNKWQPFFGNVSEARRPAALLKALEKGRSGKPAPLKAVEDALLKDVVSRDAEKAREAQVLFDALNQTRSDLVMRIRMEVGACPHRAAYDIQELLKYWPSEKKRVEGAQARTKSSPEFEALAKAFCKVMEWSSPDFACKGASDAKKIVQELNKIKKTLEKLKESKNLIAQNGALTLDLKVDELIATIPFKVPGS